MARPSIPFLVALLLLCTPATWALPAPGLLDDAGSGQDAGDAPADAMALDYGAYDGNLTPMDADWYGFAASAAPACLRASAIAVHAMGVGLEGGDGATVTGFLGEDGVFSAVLAVEPEPILLGLLPDEAPYDLASVGPYRFDIAATLPSAVGDARLADAPKLLADATPAPAECFSAHFRDDPPDFDTWSLAASADERIILSLAVGPNAAGTLRLLNASGGTVAGPISSGEAVEYDVPADGTYYVQSRSTWSLDDANYVVGAFVGPDPGNGCRPHCFL